MTLNQALKEKNVVAGQLTKLRDKLLTHNRFVKGEFPAYNTVDVLHQYRDKAKELAELKTRIAIATQPKIGAILYMAEMKSLVSTLKMMPSKAGTEIARYSAAEGTVYDVTIGEVDKDQLVDGLEAELRIAQDELDVFNATTPID